MIAHYLAFGVLGRQAVDDLAALSLEAGAASLGVPVLRVVAPVTVLPGGGTLKHGFATYPAGPMRRTVDRLGAVAALSGGSAGLGLPMPGQVHRLVVVPVTAGAAMASEPKAKRSFTRQDNAFWAAVA